MNDIIDKFLLVLDKFMPEIILYNQGLPIVLVAIYKKERKNTKV